MLKHAKNRNVFMLQPSLNKTSYPTIYKPNQHFTQESSDTDNYTYTYINRHSEYIHVGPK